MDLRFKWLEPFQLVDGARRGLTYMVADADQERLPDVPGIYIFGRRHGDGFTPVYIGQAGSLRSRVWFQLNNNRLMNSLEQARNGTRELLIGEFSARPGQRAKRALDIVERGLIKLALAEGHELVNRHGTRIRSHSVEMSGSRSARSWLPERHISFEDKKG